MNNLMATGFAAVFSMAVVAITVQNAVFARALGVSRLLSLVDDTTSTAIFGLQLTVITVLGTLGHYFLNLYILSLLPFGEYLRPLSIVLCMSVSFLLVFFLTIKLTPYKYVGKAVDMLPASTFNVIVFATILLTSASRYDLASSLIYAVGTSGGYLLAVLLVTEGQLKLRFSNIPIAFKGLPVTLLYLSGLALAIYGLTGYTFGY
ncbi:MAG: Rnf-Nqr domain containing protein [Oscillospiraceae bacterium]